jgi:hypothetical protein
MQILQLSVGVWVNIYTDSKYAFTTNHVHGVLYKEMTWFKTEREIFYQMDGGNLPMAILPSLSH